MNLPSSKPRNQHLHGNQAKNKMAAINLDIFRLKKLVAKQLCIFCLK